MSDKPTILIADDDMGLVTALAVRLEALGYNACTATDGYSSVAKAVASKPDILLLDVHMPAGGGFTVQARLENIPELAGVPVIYMTGDKSQQAKSDAETVGAFGILHKPVNIDELNDLIKSGLSTRAA